MKYWTYIICLMLTCSIQAQDSLTVIDRVIELSNSNKRPEALELIEKYSPIYESQKNYETLVSLQRLKAVVYSAIKTPGESVTQAEKTIELAKKYLEPGNYEYVESFFTLGRIYAYNYQFDESLPVLNKALKQLENIDSSDHQKAKILTTLAQVFTAQRQFDKSIKFAKQALELKLKTVDSLDSYLAPIYQAIGDNYNVTSQYDSASYYYKLFHNNNIRNYVPDHPNIGISYNSMAAVSWNAGKMDLALNYYRAAEDVFYQDFIKTGNGRYLSVICSNMGLLYQTLGEYQLAATYSKKGLEMAKRDYEADNLALVNPYILYGSAANDCEDFEAADASYKEAERIQMLQAPNEISQVAFLEAKIVDHLMRQQLYEEAQPYALSSLKYYQSVDDQSKFHLGLLDHLATIYYSQSKEELALKYANETVDLAAKIYGKGNIKTLNFESHLAKLHIKLGELESARNILKEIQRSNGNQSLIYFYSHLPATPDILDIYDIHALLLNQQNLNGVNVLEELKSLLIDFDKLYASKQAKLTEANSIQRLNRQLKSFYDQCINIFLSSDAVDEAKRLSDAYKANFLNAILNSRLINESGLYHDTTLSEIKTLENSITQLSQKMEQNSADTLDQFIELIRLKENLSQIKQIASVKNSSYYANKEKVKARSSNTSLSENEMLIQYFNSEEKLIAFKEDNGATEYKILDRQKVDSLLSIMTKNRLCELVYYKDLYKELIPFDIEGKDLLIIPDGKLFHLNFESLIDQNGDFLILNHKIRYAYSTEILQIQESLAEQIKSKEILSLTPGFTSENKANYSSNADSLLIDSFYLQILQQPFMLRVADQLRQNGADLNFTNLDATEMNYKSNNTDVRLIHLGTHGILNDRSPMMSYLIFSKSEQDTLEDGYLHTYEVYNQKINAELAVLAACQTGVSNIDGGESIQSLSHAFTYAGCPSVIMSLWKIDEKANASILQNFYDELKSKQKKSVALREAKLEFIKNAPSELRHPYYWSGLVLIGADQEMNLGGMNYTLIILITLFIILFILYLRNRKI